MYTYNTYIYAPQATAGALPRRPGPVRGGHGPADAGRGPEPGLPGTFELTNRGVFQ